MDKKYTKEEVKEMIRTQHERDLESLLDFIDKVWPSDEEVKNKKESSL